AITHPDDLVHARAAIRAHLKGETPSYQAELRLRSKSGEWRWILDRGRVVEWDARGHAVRMAGTHTDISDRKQMELQLLVSDRMVSVGRLAAGVAHEINNPLAYLATNLDFVASELARGDAYFGGPRSVRLAQAITMAREGAGRVRDIV